MDYCQATRTDPVEVTHRSQSPDGPYRLCRAARDRLVGLCLRPREWYNLAAIHGPFEVLLHDDFYDEDGTACQPEQDVVDPELFPAPSLSDVAGNVEHLVEFVGTRWFLEEDAVTALRAVDPSALLATLRQCYAKTKNPWFQDRYMEVAGRALGREAEHWVREELHRASPSGKVAILFGAGACLPNDEAVRIAQQTLADQAGGFLPRDALVLAQFRSSLVLDWIEQNIGEQVTSEWGDLAACSSLDWARVVKWLAAGRPLSLVALDALVACDCPRQNQSPLVRRLSPSLCHSPSREEAETVLNSYLERDSVPRIRRAAQHALSEWATICRDS